jgi:hypothetical protein
MSIRAGNLADLRRELTAAGVAAEDVQSLEKAIAAEPTAAGSGFGPKVSGWIGKMMAKAADGSWGIATGAAGSLLAKALEKYYGLS